MAQKGGGPLDYPRAFRGGFGTQNRRVDSKKTRRVFDGKVVAKKKSIKAESAPAG